MNQAKRLKRAKRKLQAKKYRKAYKMDNQKSSYSYTLFAGLRSRNRQWSRIKRK
jgi:hypothetical protein